MEKAGSSVLQPPHLPSGVEIILQLLGVFLHNTYSAKIKMAGLKYISIAKAFHIKK